MAPNLYAGLAHRLSESLVTRRPLVPALMIVLVALAGPPAHAQAVLTQSGVEANTSNLPRLDRSSLVPTWIEQALLTANDGRSGDIFGTYFALSGNTAIIGAPYKNTRTGAAYVYVRHGTTWTQQAKLTASDGVPNDNFGWSVALIGNVALIGAPRVSPVDPGPDAAYEFMRHGTTWRQRAKLTASDGALNDDFGFSLALFEGTAVVGANWRNHKAGAAYVFVRHGATWIQQAELTASDSQANDDLGYSIALGRNTLLVSAVRKNNTGAAYVFVRKGRRWSRQAELVASDGAADDNFGISVALSGNVALIGAPYKNNASGVVYVYVHKGSTWTRQTELSDPASIKHDIFGTSITASGRTVLVSAPGKNTDAGAAYVYLRMEKLDILPRGVSSGFTRKSDRQ